MMRIPMLIGLLAASTAGHAGQERPLMGDPGFESVPAGRLDETGASDGWEIQRTGRDVVKDRLVVSCLEDEEKARSGRKCLSLSLPKDTVGFEFVTVARRVRLSAGKDYVASAWVRWVGGPEEAPAGASPISGHPSAIVSFWSRHRDGNGDYAGRDEWLFDNRWKKISYRFRATHPARRTLVYLSLLPNQKPAPTTVLLDDFELAASEGTSEVDTRTGGIVRDAGFDGQEAERVGPPWGFANMGGKGIEGTVVGSEESRYVRISMGKDTSNFESAQLWQHVDLKRGARYVVKCRMKWDNHSPEAPAPIVNYGIYHEASRTWYGPVDQVLEKTGDWKTYRFVHVPPFGGRWKLYVQLNGWGNFGNGVTVSFDDFTCAPAAPE